MAGRQRLLIVGGIGWQQHQHSCIQTVIHLRISSLSHQLFSRAHTVSQQLRRHNLISPIDFLDQPPFTRPCARRVYPHLELESRLDLVLNTNKRRSAENKHNSRPSTQLQKCRPIELTSTTLLCLAQTMSRSTQLSWFSTVRVQLARPHKEES